MISYFDARKFWCIFVLAILTTNPFSHHLSWCDFIQNLDFLPFLHISETTRKKSALQHPLFWRYVNFSKIMRIIHTSMTSTFILNLSHLLNVKHWTFSLWNVLVLHICIVQINLEKLADNVKPWLLFCGFLTGSQDRFVLKFQGVAPSESILMKVWDIII